MLVRCARSLVDHIATLQELTALKAGDRKIEPPSYLPISILGEADRAGPGDALKSRRGDIDAVAAMRSPSLSSTTSPT